MNKTIWHIRKAETISDLWRYRCIEAYCGAVPGTEYGETFVYKREARAWMDKGIICEDCLQHPDYALYLLAGIDD